MSAALATHLRSWLGAWVDRPAGIEVVPATARTVPGWDGAVRPLLGALRPDGSGTVVVAPHLHETVADALAGRRGTALDRATRGHVGQAVHGDGAVLALGVLRWLARDEDPPPADVEPLGAWVDHRSPGVPGWLVPFGGRALVSFADDGTVSAGVGVKRHDDTGHELSVVTAAAHRGRGLATRLVATAARHELRDVPVVTYLHARDNTPSAHVAEAVGLRDRGWSVVGVFGGQAPG